jgi:hypothetical protein
MVHALCYAARALDRADEPANDERGRPVWRIRKPDIVEFSEIIERHGLYSRDLENMADALRRQGVGPFVHCDDCALNPGWVTVTRADQAPALERCACWKAWTERRNDYRAERRASA